MLLLGRRVEERFVLGANIEILVQRIQSGRVNIGVDAGKEIPVLRAESIAEWERQQGPLPQLVPVTAALVERCRRHGIDLLARN